MKYRQLLGDAAGDELGFNKSLPHVYALWPGVGIFGETAEIASSDIAEDYPKTGVLANVVTRLGPKARKARRSKTDNGRQKFVLEKNYFCKYVRRMKWYDG